MGRLIGPAPSGQPPCARAIDLNTAGSPTYRLHLDNPGCEQIGHRLGRGRAVGFRYGIVSDLQAALFIAAPIFESWVSFSLPYGAQTVSRLIQNGMSTSAKASSSSGGEWRAQVASPEGVRSGELYGQIDRSKGADRRAEFRCRAGDYVFFRRRKARC